MANDPFDDLTQEPEVKNGNGQTRNVVTETRDFGGVETRRTLRKLVFYTGNAGEAVIGTFEIMRKYEAKELTLEEANLRLLARQNLLLAQALDATFYLPSRIVDALRRPPGAGRGGRRSQAPAEVEVPS